MASSIPYFDMDQFEAQWKDFSEKQMRLIVGKARYLEPSIGIVPILAGFFSHHTQVKNDAKDNLEFLLEKITRSLSDRINSINYSNGMKESALVGAKIFSRFSPLVPLETADFFIKLLLEMGGKGPSFAFKALYKGDVNLETLGKTMDSISETGRLALVDQYLQARSSVRLKHGTLFKQIVKSIGSREPVIKFYGALFDRHQDADPFLYNIQPGLRDPRIIIETELASKDPAQKILGLKALSMLLNKIPPNILQPYLTMEETADVRVTVYEIVHNSTMGVYSDLFDPILELFLKSTGDEALHAFKAMVTCGKLPLYRLINKVNLLHPSLLPVILNEISSLSKISFFFIQEIALNKEHYTKGVPLDINLACIFGMIKKRPERVVGIFQRAAIRSKVISKTEVVRFIHKIIHLLDKEKQDIETDFLKVVSQISHEKKNVEEKHFFQKRLKDPVEKKLADLKKNIVPGRMAFEGEKILSQNLSGKDFRSRALVFNNARIQACDFSSASFSSSFFKQCVIHKVDMREAIFQNVSFDNAVLIDVDAQGAVFINCSFHKTSIYNSNFSNARIKDAVFIESVISRSFFDRTDLSGSCFAYSKLSRISFLTANIHQVDFSGVKARFSRFPHSNRTTARTEDIDYNARKFQLTFSDLPRIDGRILWEMNLLIFCEFAHYGELKFLKQNKLSLLTAYDIFKPKQADLFILIPLLIHENIDFPLLDTICEQAPCGIVDYLPTPETLIVCETYMGAKIISGQNQNPAIQALFTIGSVGSIAQTAESDIDYWVCILESALLPSQIKLLEKKLFLLEKMAGDVFNIQVTFFIVDVTKAKLNDFGDSTIESSGSAQAHLLKEEFYRTMIYLAGKIPLWAVLPTAISQKYYDSISGRISRNDPQDRYVDLGDIHSIQKGEYFGASLWQMFKWLKSPFKSILKMALLEKFIFEEQELLLCNRYKNEWMNAGSYLKLAQNDSYYFLLKHLVRYYERVDDKHSVNLLLTCFFLKLGVSNKEQIENTVFGLRKILLEKCMEKWHWDINRVLETGNSKQWPYEDIVRLSTTLEKYMLQKYKKVKKIVENDIHESAMISPEDQTVLEHKVKIEFSDQPMKVRKILLVSRGDRHFYGLHLMYDTTVSPMGEWVLFNRKSHLAMMHEDPLIRAKTIEEIGAWLMVNDLYSKKTIVNLTPNPCDVSFDEIKRLYENLYDFLSPLIKPSAGFDQLLAYPLKTAVFVSVNFYASQSEKKVMHYTAVDVNAWNEVFCRSCFTDQGFISLAHLKRDLMFKLRVSKLPAKTAFYFSKGVVK